MVKLSANFTVHKNFSYIRPALDSLLSATHTPCDVQIIINTPNDTEIRALKAEYPQVQFFINPTPLGFAANHNQFMSRTTSEFMALLNDDIILHPGALDTLVEYLEGHANVGVVGASLQNADGTPQVSAYSDPTLLRMIYKISGLAVLTRQNSLLRNWLMKIGLARMLKVESLQSQSKTRNVPVIKGAAMVVRRAAYLQVGPMDETTLGYGEEVDWHLRMRQAGWQIALVAEAQITHFGQGQARLQLEGQMLVEDRKAILNYWINYRPQWETIIIRLSIVLFHGLFALFILFSHPARSQTHRRLVRLGLAWMPDHRKS